MSSNKPRIKYLFSLGIYVMGGLFAFELLIRLFFYGPGPFYIFDPDLGYSYGAGTKIFNGIEGFGTIRFVADGEIATPYSGGKNVVVLGDSHTVAIQVDDNNNFVSIAEEVLREEGYFLDLHNYGGIGARIPDYIYIADNVIQRYHPEILVIQLSVDDFFGNSFDPNQASYFDFASDGSLIIKHNVPINKHIAFIETLNHYSALTNFAYERLYRIWYKIAHRRGGVENDHDAALSQSQQISLDLIKMELQILIDAYPDIPIVFVMLPSTPRIENSDILFHENGYKAVTDVIQDMNGLYLVDPLPMFNNLVYEGRFPRGFQNTVSGNGHLNVNGHHIVGRLLALALKQIVR